MGKNLNSIKVCNELKDFLKKFRTNRRKMDIDEMDASYWELLLVIRNFFKLDNEAYIKLVKMEKVKCQC